MFLPSPSTGNVLKDSPNHVAMNMIGLSQTSREILEDGDIPIFPVVLSTMNSLQFNFIVPVSRYPPYAWRLI